MSEDQRAKEVARGLSDDDRKHVFHAWMQAEDGDGIRRPNIDVCVQHGFMEKWVGNYWEFTDLGAAVADAIYGFWRDGHFDPITGCLVDAPEPRP